MLSNIFARALNVTRVSNDSAPRASRDMFDSRLSRARPGSRRCFFTTTKVAEYERQTNNVEYCILRTKQWEMKQMALEEERRVRLERIRSENDKNVDRIREESSASLDEATQAWKVERKDLERGLMEKARIWRCRKLLWHSFPGWP